MTTNSQRRAILLLTLLVGLLLLGGRLVGGRTGMLVAVVPAAALADGRDARHAAITVTTGLFDLLDLEEGSAILAHELGHVAAGDALLGGITATVVVAFTLPLQIALRGIQWVSDAARGYAGGRDWADPGFARPRLVAGLTPVVAPLMRLAASAEREHRADQFAAYLVGTALPLAAAIEKLDEATDGAPPFEADPGIHHLLTVGRDADGLLGRLLATRPTTVERLQRLRQFGAGFSDSLGDGERPQPRSGAVVGAA